MLILFHDMQIILARAPTQTIQDNSSPGETPQEESRSTTRAFGNDLSREQQPILDDEMVQSVGAVSSVQPELT